MNIPFTYAVLDMAQNYPNKSSSSYVDEGQKKRLCESPPPLCGFVNLKIFFVVLYKYKTTMNKKQKNSRRFFRNENNRFPDYAQRLLEEISNFLCSIIMHVLFDPCNPSIFKFKKRNTLMAPPPMMHHQTPISSSPPSKKIKKPPPSN